MRSPLGVSLPVFALFIQALFFLSLSHRRLLSLLPMVILCSILSLAFCLVWIVFKEHEERQLLLSEVMWPSSWRPESRRLWRRSLFYTLSAAALICAAGWFTGKLY